MAQASKHMQYRLPNLHRHLNTPKQEGSIMKKGIKQLALSIRCKGGFDKWRVFFLIFLVVYMYFLLLDLGVMTIQWDEANHLNGGLLLLNGDIQSYMDSAMFYPPLDDVITAISFGIWGISVFSARLVAAIFALFSLLVIYESVNKVIGKRTALLSAIFLGTMPGFIWAARVALVETILIFFFSLTLFLFFMWLRTSKSWLLSLSGVMLGLGILAKYQTIIALLIMAASVIFLCKNQIRHRLSRLPFLIIVAFIITVPWILFSYQIYSTVMIDQWFYAMNIGNPDKLVYSSRFALPIFYLIEMVYPYGVVHPVSFFVYTLGLLGFGLLLWRRRPEDKLLLIWFAVVYIFFTLIGNRQWRYVVPLFPVLAISAANLMISGYDKMKIIGRNIQHTSCKRQLSKVGAGLLIFLVCFSIVYSCADAYTWVAKDYSYNLPVEEATNYVATRLDTNERLTVLCSVNVFCPDIIKFYLQTSNPDSQGILQYPDYPVDTFTPEFDVNELILLCEQHNVKYLMLFEYGEIYPYYESTLTQQQVHTMLIESQRFTELKNFGSTPCRIFILTFAQNTIT